MSRRRREPLRAKHPHRDSPAISCIDLFAGCGGLSLGAVWAGMRVAFAVDNDRNAAMTYRANFPQTTFLEVDIRQLTGRHLEVRAPYLIIIAGPPCQPFSASNQKTRGPDHPNNGLYNQALRLSRDIRPDAIVLENVEGFGTGKSRVFHEDLCDKLERMGYFVTSEIHCATDYGIPQSRRRRFIIARTGQQALLRAEKDTRQVGVWEAIADLPDLDLGACFGYLPYRAEAKSDYAATLRGGLESCDGHLVTTNAPHIAARYPFIPPGGNWRDIPAAKMKSYADATRCHTGIYHRLDPDRPAKVIGNFRKNMLIHPYCHRGLSVREAARLQSFPDAFSFQGSIGKQQQQVGNAVPPLLAAGVLKSLVSAVAGGCPAMRSEQP